MSFYNLVNRDKNQAIYVYFMTQYSKRLSTDWISTVLSDLNDLNIDSSFSFIENISIHKFKNLLKERIKTYAFNQMLIKKANYSKLQNINYDDLSIQPYLIDEKTTISEKLILFKWRMQMEDSFGENFR